MCSLACQITAYVLGWEWNLVGTRWCSVGQDMKIISTSQHGKKTTATDDNPCVWFITVFFFGCHEKNNIDTWPAMSLLDQTYLFWGVIFIWISLYLVCLYWPQETMVLRGFLGASKVAGATGDGSEKKAVAIQPSELTGATQLNKNRRLDPIGGSGCERR